MLWLWLFVFLAAMVGFTFAFRYAMNRAGEAVGKATHERFTAAEEIAASGRVPAGWLRHPRSPPYPPEERRRLLRRMDELLRYFEGAPVFDGEGTRRMLLSDLRAARERWERGEWEAAESEAGERGASGARSPSPERS